MKPIVSILAELPESLHLVLTQYLDAHPECDQDQVLVAALSLFLMQNGDRDSVSVATFANCNLDL